MKKCFAALPAIALFAVAGSALATPVVVTKWTFNEGTINPSTGTGTMLLVGGVTPQSTTFASGSGSSDGGSAYNVDHFPSQGIGSGTGGFEFQVSTVGYTNVTFSFDGRTSNTASRNYQVQYSTDSGANWNESTVFSPFTNTNFHNNNLVDLTGLPGVDNNPNFRVRVVAVFQFGTGAYQAAGATSTYNGATGTFRIDAVTLSGEPAASIAPTGTGGALPAAVCLGEPAVLTVTVGSGQNPPSNSYTVTADLSSMGGSATQQFFDDGTNGDVFAFDGTFSYGVTAAGTAGLKSLPFTVTDDQSRTASGNISFGVGDCANNANSTVVISQVYGGGGSAGAGWDGDFVELFNRSSAAVSVDGWSVQYASSGGVVSTQQIRALTGSIPAGGYYLVRMSNQAGGNALPTPDAGGEIAVGGGIFMSNTAGKVFLANIGSAVSGCDDAAIMDHVGYGAAASCFEGAGAAPDLTGGSPALLRKSNGCQDSDENFNDFEFAFDANPRNSATAAAPCQTTPACGTSDYNGDGDFGTDADIEAFFACLAGQCCATCYEGGSDFNADGDFGTDADIESFFRVLAGGAC